MTAIKRVKYFEIIACKTLQIMILRIQSITILLDIKKKSVPCSLMSFELIKEKQNEIFLDPEQDFRKAILARIITL